MIYHDEPPSINWYDFSMRSLCEVTWQIKYIMSPPEEDPWTPNQARCWLTMSDTYPYSHMTLWSRDQREAKWQFEMFIFSLMNSKPCLVLTYKRRLLSLLLLLLLLLLLFMSIYTVLVLQYKCYYQYTSCCLIKNV